MSSQKYYSQFGEDEWLDKTFELPEAGVFVDVGASDGITKSNTYFFEQRGWTGICIDPDPRHSESLRRNRACVELCAVASHQGSVSFYLHESRPTRSGIDCRGEEYRPIEVPCYPLSDLLQRHAIEQIDILDIDVEGTELEVWESFDVDRHRPQLVIIEFSPDRVRGTKEVMVSAFARHPYRLVHETPANLLFLREPDTGGGPVWHSR